MALGDAQCRTSLRGEREREREREKQLGATINGGKSAVDCAEEDANPFGPRHERERGREEERERGSSFVDSFSSLLFSAAALMAICCIHIANKKSVTAAANNGGGRGRESMLLPQTPGSRADSDEFRV